CHAGKQLHQRGLAGAVRADDAEHLTLMELERDVAQRPELVAPDATRATAHHAAQGARERRRRRVGVALRGGRRHAVALAEAFGSDDHVSHQATSANSRAKWLK